MTKDSRRTRRFLYGVPIDDYRWTDHARPYSLEPAAPWKRYARSGELRRGCDWASCDDAHTFRRWLAVQAYSLFHSRAIFELKPHRRGEQQPPHTPEESRQARHRTCSER